MVFGICLNKRDPFFLDAFTPLKIIMPPMMRYVKACLIWDLICIVRWFFFRIILSTNTCHVCFRDKRRCIMTL